MEQKPPLPSAFVARIEEQFAPDAAALLEALDRNAITSVLLHPQKGHRLFEHEEKIAWNQLGKKLSERPSFTLDPLYHAGAYYSQESSSMFVDEIMRQLFQHEKPQLALDLCAAPGGKSLLLSSHLAPDGVLVSNEIIKTRNSILRENLTKWGVPNFICTQSESSAFSDMYDWFDVVLVDAPCSGEGMFRKDPNARAEWSTENVALCAARQSDIVQDILPSIKPGGILIYSTCTFAPEENEARMRELEAHPDFENVSIMLNASWPIHVCKTERAVGYQFLPHLTDGEGFFVTVFRKKGIGQIKRFGIGKKHNYYHALNKKEEQVVRSAAQHLPNLLLDDHGGVQAFTADEALVSEVARHVHLTQVGIQVGTLIRQEFVPDHGLVLLAPATYLYPTFEVSKEDALSFLRKQEMSALPSHKGWVVIAYEGQAIGLLKSLGNRANNYYPKEWRIRMQ
jgi:16S rRNA C967 or C1407 C5-methylase (RsmB/RsmF family)/NOL1/NOP2/fmu family ribosome biogenesis protein